MKRCTGPCSPERLIVQTFELMSSHTLGKIAPVQYKTALLSRCAGEGTMCIQLQKGQRASNPTSFPKLMIIFLAIQSYFADKVLCLKSFFCSKHLFIKFEFRSEML